MDDNAKNASSYHLDQEILDARGIRMTVEEVAGLPTTKYSERVQSLCLCEQDLAFLKGLRRRIKNRLASQNSRRRSMEHLRRLTRELRAVRACRDDALSERRVLMVQRDELRSRCQRLRQYVAEILKERSDNTAIPSVDIDIDTSLESQIDLSTVKTPDCITDRNTFECRIDKLVQQSVNHIYKTDKKTVFAKTVFIEDLRGEVLKDIKDVEDSAGVLNLSVKNEGRRRSHGRKQSAPRRIAYVEYDVSDCVLDLKIKKEPQ